VIHKSEDNITIHVQETYGAHQIIMLSLRQSACREFRFIHPRKFLKVYK